MAKLTNKQHEQAQDRRLSKLEQRANADDKIVAKHEKRLNDLAKQLKNLRTKSRK